MGTWLSTARRQLRHQRVNVYSATLTEKTSQQPLRLHYVGSASHYHDFAQRIGDPATTPATNPATSTREWFPREIYALLRERHDADMVVIEMNQQLAWILEGAPRFFVPFWIGGGVYIADSMRQLRKSDSLASDLRKIHKFAWRYRSTYDEADFREFYQRMYVPHIHATYGAGAMITAYDELKREFDHGVLLLAYRDTVAEAGSLITRRRGQLCCAAIGVGGDKSTVIHEGGLAALYYFELQYAYKLGESFLHYGAARPFLNDGVLRYKRKWGFHVTDHDPRGWLVIPSFRTPAVRQFLVANPFVHVRDGTLEPTVFFSGAAETDYFKCYKRYQMSGLHRFVCYSDAVSTVSTPIHPQISIRAWPHS